MRWKFDFKVGNEYPPIEICNDDDLQFYMLSDNLLQVPLCISIERKSISGSNQVDCGNAEDAIFEVFGNALGENALDQNALDHNALDENALDENALDENALDQNALDQNALDENALDH